MQIDRCSSREMSEISEISEGSEGSERSERSERRANNCSATIGYIGQTISYLSLIITFAVMDGKCKNFDIISGFYLAGVCSGVLSASFLIHSIVPSYIKLANEKGIPKKNFFAVWWASGKEDGEHLVDKEVNSVPLYITGNLVYSIGVALLGLYVFGCDEVLANRLAGPNLEG